MARFSGAEFEDTGLYAFDDLGLAESLAGLFLVRVAVAAILQEFDVVARGVVCMLVASGCAFLDVVAWLEEVLPPVGGGGDSSDDGGVDGDDDKDDRSDEDEEHDGDGGEALIAP